MVIVMLELLAALVHMLVVAEKNVASWSFGTAWAVLSWFNYEFIEYWLSWITHWLTPSRSLLWCCLMLTSLMSQHSFNTVALECNFNLQVQLWSAWFTSSIVASMNHKLIDSTVVNSINQFNSQLLNSSPQFTSSIHQLDSQVRFTRLNVDTIRELR